MKRLFRWLGIVVAAVAVLPWENYAELTDADVRSLFRYLRTLAPVAASAGPSHRPLGWKPEGR